MRDSHKLKEYLIRNGITNEEHFEQALECISTGSVSLDQALVSLNLVDHTELGACLSEMYELPYSPVLAQQAPDAAVSLFSRERSQDWEALPVAYDPDEDLLTLAVHDPEQIIKLDRVHRFFMQPYSVAYTITSQAEMHDNLNPSSEPKANDQDTGQTLTADAEHATSHAKTKMAIGGTGASGFTYAEMGRGIISTAALAARVFLVDDEEKLLGIRTRVRYCQLLSSRLSLSEVETDRLTLSAWLSALEENRGISKDLVTPYDLEEVLFSDDIPLDEQRAEAQILGLVRCYEALGKEDSDACKDVNLTRRHLHNVWSSSPAQQNMLETFLQVLMDEEFLSKMDHVTGHVLIVDPDETSMSVLSAPLAADGYKVEHAPNAARAEDIMEDIQPDLILCAIELPHGSGVSLCQKVKQSSTGANIPFVLMADEDDAKRAAESLRAGADDFLTKPVDLEVLFLKLHRLIAAPEADNADAGVSGTLEDMSFTDMIQIICAGGKSMEITLTRDDLEGKVWVQAGNIVHAGLKDLEGPEAFYALMQWQEGKFTTNQCSEFPAKTIEVSAMGLLMEGARLADESNAEA
jgi:CheY-like chemotaxis protein